ncbi:hypothetical protein HNR40_006952 [Nonomuraea endophytica]|uniref:Uncharacterized protein n=1 Tax=Nonomuraea endophytica TaxID=714136 RepID=A0A7W8A8A5_9ACTN|nr:hypothetical protein [Nonomuraea endophytica]
MKSPKRMSASLGKICPLVPADPPPPFAAVMVAVLAEPGWYLGG